MDDESQLAPQPDGGSDAKVSDFQKMVKAMDEFFAASSLRVPDDITGFISRHLSVEVVWGHPETGQDGMFIWVNMKAVNQTMDEWAVEVSQSAAEASPEEDLEEQLRSDAERVMRSALEDPANWMPRDYTDDDDDVDMYALYSDQEGIELIEIDPVTERVDLNRDALSHPESGEG